MPCKYCGRHVRIESYGYCSACYNRLYRNGRLERVNVVNKGKQCSKEGCEKPALAKGLCQYHYDTSGHELKILWSQLRARKDHDLRWDDFNEFLKDVGERPSKKHQLRRLDKTKPFSKENTSWLEPIPCTSKDPNYGREHQLRREYGLSLKQYNQMLDDQNGVCAICLQPETQLHRKHGKLRELCVDHCHTTGKIRGLLCSDCNTTLGRVKDSIITLQRAIEYLKTHLVK